MSTLRLAPLALAAALLVPPASRARADGLVPTLQLEGGAQVMLTDAYRDRFDWGGLGFARVGLELFGPLALQLGFGTAWFPVADQDAGNLYAFELGARGFFVVDPVAGGPFVDANVGVGLTGELVRLVFDVGVGWELLPVEWLGIGPVVRYQQIVQPDGEAQPDDAHLLSFGLSVTARIDVGGGAPAAAPAAPVDSDGDGLRDDVDRCPDLPEDLDGVADTDGCPEDDFDEDGIPDERDACPTAAEVRNGFEDEDGCPDEAPPPPPAAAPAAAAPARALGAPAGEPLSQEVRFRIGSDRVSGRWATELDEVIALLRAQPSLRVRVIGHADEQGTPAGNARLGAARAGAVAAQLVLGGIAPERIESVSYGDTQPVCRDGSVECLARNRRVAFEVLRGD